ncbi:asparaginase [Candidatus Xianfuyuplasma coldseepsis]|uniref:asparaginase n=1 Tax=Candidatus Xianfuyuplasma coldseepsis TaxID=2782163 RepID=A0A7L7KST2_9MOLU|nr:asparaginase [Xianfuyuplasma coldseepsis]QMS85803.1 asparaginase [Xianfuyuplasma coldseepsis]
MKHVVLIFTGGTIGMKIDQNAHGVIPSLTPNEIIHALTGIEEYPNLIVHEFSRKPSPSITPKDMQSLATLVQDYLNRDDVAGAIVIHGTDVLEETAFYLHCVVQSRKPVVLTGSMKNASEFGYDGVTNLVSSIKVCYADDSMGKGTLVVMNDTINSAIEVTKTHTMSLDTFKSIEFGPLGIIDQGEVIYYRDVTHFKTYNLDNNINDDTYLLKAYAGMTGDYIQHLVNKQARGIVIESLGRGNLPPQTMDALDEALHAEVFVVIVSRCYSGRVLDTYAYEGGGRDLTNRGCILGGSFNGQKARILLMLAISNNYTYDDIVNLFEL